MQSSELHLVVTHYQTVLILVIIKRKKRKWDKITFIYRQACAQHSMLVVRLLSGLKMGDTLL